MQACGSGGTTAGIALGNHLSNYGAKIWAYGVCDDPEYFYSYIDGIFKDLGAPSGKLVQHDASPDILFQKSQSDVRFGKFLPSASCNFNQNW